LAPRAVHGHTGPWRVGRRCVVHVDPGSVRRVGRDGQSGAETVDPLTGQGLAPYAPSTFTRWVKDLHRALFMGTPGHGVSGVGALFMLIL
ncbi:PepSY domain-containing protein, partial [Salmonella enterica]